MKSDLTCYEYKQTLIADLNPGHRYPEQALLPKHKIVKKRDARYNLERIRTSAITQKRNHARFYQGRIHTHLKLEQLKEDVANIRDNESVQKSQDTFQGKRGIIAPDVQIDDQFLLPYGAGYDHIIKQKAELIDSQKQANNEVMDALVLRLGYMDYRDALACNKYIIESKLSGDYH